MTDPVAARLATTRDLAPLRALCELAERETRPQRGGELFLDHDRHGAALADGLDAALEAPAAGAWTGLIGEVVVGYGTARLAEQGDVRVAVIDDLFVHPDARGVGVAAAILELITDWSRSHACAALESQVLPGNRDAKNFFERVGMVTRQMRVSTRLD